MFKFLKKRFVFSTLLKIAGVIVPILILIALGFYFEKSGSFTPELSQAAADDLTLRDDIPGPSFSEIDDSPLTSDEENETMTPNYINVYIVGEISNPAVYKIEEKSLLADLIEAAGGATENADLESINLAFPLSDNMMIRIPSLNDDYESGLWLLDSGGQKEGASETLEGEESASKVNINTADLSSLCTLPGVGSATAQKIIDYRTIHGDFETISDIMNVPGIKTAKYEKIKNHITVN